MSKPLDLAGQRFGRLTAIRDVGRSGRKVLWECRCDCGAIRSVTSARLRSGGTKGCGCVNRGNARHGAAGLVKTSEYRSWLAARRRCMNPTDKDYPRYGGRGITFCERWNRFEDFLADMGTRPPGTSIDRIDNAGNYEPGNCRWATTIEQARNKRGLALITHGGETLCLSEWAERLGLPLPRLAKRRENGWPDHEVLFGRTRSHHRSTHGEVGH